MFSNNQTEFKVGDIVELKSGGPDMTVTDPNWNDEVRCQWFLQGKIYVGVFPANALRKITNSAIEE
jgi:uncharacterized protein YodC (DUF2158 family)